MKKCEMCGSRVYLHRERRLGDKLVCEICYVKGKVKEKGK